MRCVVGLAVEVLPLSPRLINTIVVFDIDASDFIFEREIVTEESPLHDSAAREELKCANPLRNTLFPCPCGETDNSTPEFRPQPNISFL